MSRSFSAHRGRRRAVECDCAARRPSLFYTWLGAIAPLAAAVLRTADWLTPAFGGVFTFRLRIVGGLALLAALAVLGAVVAKKRHRAAAPGAPAHYSHPRWARRVAAFGAAAAAAVLILSSTDLAYLRGTPGPIRLRVSTAAGLPSSGVTVDLLDLDTRPITRAPAVTDAFGVATLDLRDGQGRPASLSTTTSGCHARTRIPAGVLRRRIFWNEWERSERSVSAALECPAQAAVAMPFWLPVTAGVEHETEPGGPWPSDPWMVELRLRARHPGSPSDVTVSVIAPDGASAHRGDVTGGDVPFWMIRPSARSPERPTHLTLLVTAPGQKPLRLNLGPLAFARRGASDVASVETDVAFEPDVLPAVTHVSRVVPNPGEAAAFDVTVLNPYDREIAITRVVVEAEQPRPPLTKCSGGATSYDVSLTVSGRTIRPQRQTDDAFAFPVSGTLSRLCGATEVQAAVAFDRALAPRETSVLRFVFHEGLKRTRGTPAILGPVLNDREYDWTLRLEIDRDLVITGDYHPPRALFGR